MHKRAWYSIFSILVVIAVLSWLAVLTKPTDKLRIIACDVGQGDATIVMIGSFQMLVDGGANNKVISCLGKYMPFWDRTIEVVVNTHPDADHYVGLIEVLKLYDVKNFVATEVNKDNQSYSELKLAVSDENLNLTIARKGDRIVYGNVYIDILSPENNRFENTNEKVLGSMDVSDEDSNSYSIVMHLSFGEFDALLTGDITPEVSDSLAGGNLVPDVEYLQVPHHGSKNGLTKALLEKASPEISTISAGRNNRYGHPHKDILNLLEGYKVVGTYEVGDVVVESDGSSWDLF